MSDGDYRTALQGTDAAVVLFQFHTAFDLCSARIALLHRLNPGLRVFGLYGGEPAAVPAPQALGMEHVYHDPGQPPAWNKKNTDLAVCGWFRQVGHDVPFDRVHVVQWDLLFFAPLDRVYPALPPASVALSGLVPLDRIAHFWDWVAFEPLATDSRKLLDMARREFGYDDEPHACLGPGYSLSRVFLERYSALNLKDDTGHDELRLPLFAQILGVPLVDTGFYPRWMDPAIEAVFNADAHEIDPELVARDLGRADGRRVFHPCRELYSAELIASLTAITAP